MVNAMKKKQTLNDILEKLTKEDSQINEEVVKQYIIDFKEVYSEDKYRHRYSEISAGLQKILEQDNGESKTVSLTTNLKIILNQCKSSDVPFLEKIEKLYDHISLEINRVSYINNNILNEVDSKISMYENRVKDIKESINELETIDVNIKRIEDELSSISQTQEKVEELKENVEKVDADLKKNNISIITTMSIFSAIVLTFSGSISISNNIISNVNSNNVNIMMLTSFALGLIFFNIIFLLLYIVSKIIGIKICTNLEIYDEIDDVKKFKNLVHVYKRSYPYMYFSNLILLSCFVFFYFIINKDYIISVLTKIFSYITNIDFNINNKYYYAFSFFVISYFILKCEVPFRYSTYLTKRVKFNNVLKSYIDEIDNENNKSTSVMSNIGEILLRSLSVDESIYDMKDKKYSNYITSVVEKSNDYKELKRNIKLSKQAMFSLFDDDNRTFMEKYSILIFVKMWILSYNSEKNMINIIKTFKKNNLI